MSDEQPVYTVGAAVRDTWTHLEGEIATVYGSFFDLGTDVAWLSEQLREITPEDLDGKWLRIVVPRSGGVLVIPVRYAVDAWDVEQ